MYIILHWRCLYMQEFKNYLEKSNFSKNTVDSYYFAVNQFYQQYDSMNKQNLKNYKIWLVENYKPKTVNLRIRAINCYLDFLKKGSLKLTFVKIQQMNIPWWRSHPIHENRATKSIWTEPCNPLLRATKSTKRATSA